jgi:uncharacterized membrane protein
MPYCWTEPPPGPGAPLASLRLWPHRSLPRQGFVAFFAISFALVALPLIAVLGSPVLWFLLAFVALALGGMWLALRQSYRDGEILEDLTLWADRVRLVRQGPRSRVQTWEANPHWVRVTLHPSGGPVPHYLTMTGAGREVEIGGFLSEEERRALYHDLAARLRGAATAR